VGPYDCETAQLKCVKGGLITRDRFKSSEIQSTENAGLLFILWWLQWNQEIL